ncbi:Glutamate-rich WD repeat-containing protein 1 [Anthophora quadrimaculata]
MLEEIPKEMECEPMNEVNEDVEENDNDSDNEESMESDEAEEKEDQDNESEVYLPGKPLKSGEELVVDKTAYRMLHHAQSGAPCLSFDVISDDLGNNREDYPLSMYLVAGTQAAKTHVNNLLVMKMKKLSGIKDDSDDESDDNDDDDDKDDTNTPIMSVAPIKHQGCVNRVRYTKIGETTLAASWSELGRVHIWNLEEQLKFQRSSFGRIWTRLVFNRYRYFSFRRLQSVEDIQWSPNERHVLASCSTDKSIKIWDTRASPQSACMLTTSGTHTADINVISWNRKESQFLVSGGDDGLICIWDLRLFGPNGSSPLAVFKQHSAPVTTVEWHPEEATVFASGGADDQIAQWDLSVEADQSEETESSELKELPPQLLFIHQGQTDIKELHWHPQCPGVLISTAHSGFNIFRTISV